MSWKRSRKKARKHTELVQSATVEFVDVFPDFRIVSQRCCDKMLVNPQKFMRNAVRNARTVLELRQDVLGPIFPLIVRHFEANPYANRKYRALHTVG